MVRVLMRAGLRRGLLGGSRPWLLVGGIAASLRVLGRLTRKEPEVVFREELRPGTALLVTGGRQGEPEVHTTALR